MTAYLARLEQRNPKGKNIKEGRPGTNRTNKAGLEAIEKEFEAAGFKTLDWNKRSYTWEGDFPVFTIKPGTVNEATGLVATANLPSDVKVWFPYGTPPADIKRQLDDEILAIMRCAADIQDAPLHYSPAGEWIPF